MSIHYKNFDSEGCPRCGCNRMKLKEAPVEEDPVWKCVDCDQRITFSEENDVPVYPLTDEEKTDVMINRITRMIRQKEREKKYGKSQL